MNELNLNFLNEKTMQIIKNSKEVLFITILFILSGCASSLMDPNKPVKSKNLQLEKSYLKQTKPTTIIKNAEVIDDGENPSEFTRISQSTDNQGSLKLEIDLSAQFGTDKNYQVSVNELPLNDFLHYILGELLKVSYLIEPTVKTNITPVTLELKEKVSAQRLFQLVQQILNQHNTTVALNDEVFYVHPILNKGNKSDIAFGYGRTELDVPSVSSDIVQLVPLKYGTSIGLRKTITALVNAKITLDSAQGLITIEGKRQEVLRALSLIHLLDSSEINNKSVALLSFTYIDSETFIEKISELLALEGIFSKRTVVSSASIQFVPIEHLGKVVVFASAEEVLDRVEYWTKQLDKPATGSEQNFYTYHPQYARASDLGTSLAPLISNKSGSFSGQRGNTSSVGNIGNNQQKQAQGAGNNSTNVQSIESDNLRMVVDERSNSLIFYSTGKFYQELQPIIKKLDVMPKQVMLEVVIAEVKLTGSFAKGVDFAIQNGSLGKTNNTVSYNSNGGFGYSVVGINGHVNIDLNQTDGLINVLSRPTILVRDGVSASISVGDDIPTVGSTTSDPINGQRETTTIQYRTTGIDLLVTPTINAQGTVIMSIEQNISNLSPDGVSVGGSPSIFERKLSTEVVAGDGQTVMLGGLISENKSSNASSVPFFGSVPLIGHLFRSDSDSSDKTELVILVTPRIINSIEEWDRIQRSFISGLENIKF